MTKLLILLTLGVIIIARDAASKPTIGSVANEKSPSQGPPPVDDAAPSKGVVINIRAPFMLKFCMKCQQIFRNPTNPSWSADSKDAAKYYK